MSKRSLLTMSLLAFALWFQGAVAAADPLADPTRPPRAVAAGPSQTPAAAPLPPPRWDLQAILVGEDRRIAVINGRPLAEQGRLGAATVSRIGADAVQLRYQGKIVTLQLRRVDPARKPNFKVEAKQNP